MVLITFVIPRTPIFGLEEVEPFPVPKSPSSTQEIPSTNMPLQTENKQPNYSIFQTVNCSCPFLANSWHIKENTIE